MNEYTLEDFKEDVVSDLKNYANPSSMKIDGLEDEFRDNVEFPSLKKLDGRLEGKILNPEVQEKLKQLKDDIEMCEKKGGDIILVWVFIPML